MRIILAIMIIILASTAVAAENEISYRKISADSFSLKISSRTLLEVATAQELLLPTARALCDGKYPEYGHYEFESGERISSESNTSLSKTFVLTQDIECVKAPVATVPDTRSFIEDAGARQTIEENVRDLSKSYFLSLIAGRYKEADDHLSDSMRSYRSFDEWINQIDEFRTSTGGLVELNIHTITVYDNPPNSPQPGIYVAADYQNRFADAPYHCGYLLWFRAEADRFKITREETGLITNQTLEEVPKEQLPQILNQMRCTAR